MKQENWTDNELRSSVKAYLEIRNLQMQGEKVNKSAVYRLLSDQHSNRTAKSFEYRLQNISHVFALMGRPWVDGLKPARNVGTDTAAKLEKLIHLQERKSFPPVVAFEQSVLEVLKRKSKKVPEGNIKPKTRQVTSTQYDRDPEVVAWVLQEANGVCECCQSPAPFSKPTGDPYLEVHHVRRLADGGSDTVFNAVALCPNCHRELHHGHDQTVLREQIYLKQNRLVAE